jgi:hypothetical protein
MSDTLAQVGQFFSGPSGKALGEIAGIGATGAGLAGNIANERARSKELDYLKQQQAALANPTVLAQEVASATQPLNRALVESVGNQVSGTLAEQGLSQAPGIQATTLAQALSPFEQQNQQTALQLVLQRLGLPISYAQSYLSGLPANANLSPLIAMLMKMGGGPTPEGGGTNLPAILNLIKSAQMPGQQTAQSQLPDWLTPPPDSSSMGDFSLPSETYA